MNVLCQYGLQYSGAISMQIVIQLAYIGRNIMHQDTPISMLPYQGNATFPPQSLCLLLIDPFVQLCSCGIFGLGATVT